LKKDYEGSAPPVAVVVGSMACADNAIPGRVPQSENPVFSLGEDFQAGRISALRAESEWAAE